MKIRQKKNFFYFSVSLAFLFIIGLAMPTFAIGASFYLSPSQGNYGTGEDFSINVFINSDGVSINAGQAEIYFPLEKLRILNLSKVGSIFNLWVEEPVFSNSQGKISFGGGLPNPGYSGEAGKVITIFFRAFSEGEAKITFGKEIITANDPKGTNVFSFSQEGTFTILSPEKLPPGIMTDSESPHPFEITIDNRGDPTNPSPLLYFQTKDEISGMSHYEIKINDKLVRLNVGETMPFRLPKLTPGIYEILVKAFDKAGNFTQSQVEITIESIPVPQITICSKILNPPEELLYAGGTALANSKVIVFFEEGHELIKEWEVNSDGEGNWFLVKEIMVKSGNYKISARTEDERGAISNPSEPCVVKVVFEAVAIGPLVINYRTLNLLFLLILFIILTLLLYLFQKTYKTRRLIQRETDDLKKKFSREYKELQIVIQKQLETLRKDKTKRELSEKEKEMEKKLFKELTDVEEVFTKELRDIEEIK